MFSLSFDNSIATCSSKYCSRVCCGVVDVEVHWDSGSNFVFLADRWVKTRSVGGFLGGGVINKWTGKSKADGTLSFFKQVFYRADYYNSLV